MNLLEVLRSPSTQQTAWRGQWARIWLQPSIFSAQRFLIGLAMLDDSGLRDFKLITGTEKFACVYNESGRELVDQIVAQTRQALARARELHHPLTGRDLPPGVELEPAGMAADRSPGHALEAAMVEAEIPMEPRPDQAKAPRFKSRPAEEVVNEVLDSIRLRMHMEANNLIKLDHFGDEKHIGTVNLVRPNAAGMVVSGWYASSQRVQLELLLAVNMVESYMAHHQKTGQAAVFLLAPTTEDGLSAKQSQEIDDALDQIDYHLRSRNLRSAVRNRSDDLAADVAEWAHA